LRHGLIERFRVEFTEKPTNLTPGMPLRVRRGSAW
jgi:hypothetical protein